VAAEDAVNPSGKATETIRSFDDDERLRLLVDGVKDFAIVMLDTDGRVTTWNAGAERLKGYKAEEITGADFARFYAPEDLEAGKPREALAIAETEGRFEEEGWRVRKDGSRFWANVVITALRDPAGRLLGYGEVMADVTERKRGEREREQLLGQLRALNADLERRVEARTAELMATLEEREVLLQEVHHRVKNNLQVIASLISMQARALRGEEASRVALHECKARVEAIALIHEKLYQSRDYSQVPFSEYARSLAPRVSPWSSTSRTSRWPWTGRSPAASS
jgi:PAS domain S-box-containing protein